ncbi:hypothetical protein [uncultured Eudoraea sp.]|uniref:hypothetical protein n=1 Tax=uncultured Eudoraea sp. TaxID=1035614 RepID=UPI00261282F4|nr:hypothetical protein [uncultured Eudoraea sp.]
MKILKRLLKIFFALIGVLALTTIIMLWVELQRTGYLKIKKNELTTNDSYLITNLNVILMNQETVLVDKMVYVSEGIIEKIADRYEPITTIQFQ